jgi:hypothetical protein
MSAIIPLGSFERVTLTQAWPTEDRNFTRRQSFMDGLPYAAL